MTKRRTALLVLIPAAVIAAFFGVQNLRTDIDSVSVGKRAPQFTAVSLDSGARVKTLDDYRGDVVLLNIWATWCAPCRVEMPSIQNLHADYAARGLKVVAVSIDAPGTAAQIKTFTDSLGLTFEILHDSTGAIKQHYRTTGVPETVIIGRDGLVRKRVVGAIHWDSPANRALVEQLLAKPAA